MAGFLYFVKGDQRPPTRERILAWGLGYAFPKGAGSNRGTSQGPGGGGGNVFCDDERQDGKDIGYYPDQQTWRKLPKVEGRPELHVGYWNDAKPRPGDLRRTDALSGLASIEMGEGCHWSIPRLTELDDTGEGECLLPAPEDFDEDGNLYVTNPVGEDGELWAAIHPLAMALCGFTETELTLDELRAGAIRLIQRNYLVSMPELAVMGSLARDGRYKECIIASCRARWLLEAIANATADDEKKTDSEPVENTSSTSGGAAA